MQWFTHKFGAYGNCYTFNQDIADSLAESEDFRLPLAQDSAGPTGGLKILLDIQTVSAEQIMQQIFCLNIFNWNIKTRENVFSGKGK